MSSESGQRLPMEELKRRNAPQSMIPQNCPSKEEWQELLHRLGELERHTAAPPARKALRRERQIKIALGHKEDDHEEEPTWQQTM